MSELSQQKIDVNKIEIIPDKASFTGYSIKPLDPNAEEGMPGLPASVFEVALYKENRRLREEKLTLRNFLDTLRGFMSTEDLTLDEFNRLFERYVIDVAA